MSNYAKFLWIKFLGLITSKTDHMAYGRSAFFAHTLIHEFKLSKRYIKTVNMDVISLGFPEQTVPKWLNGYVYEWVQDGLIRCRMRKKFDEVEFYVWKVTY